jgi:hypothetical protein
MVKNNQSKKEQIFIKSKKEWRIDKNKKIKPNNFPFTLIV